MKAKDYFNRYLTDFPGKDPDWKTVKILREIFCEAQELATARNAKTDSAYRAIFRELNTKANSFCAMVNKHDNLGLVPDAFRLFVKAEDPSLYAILFP